MNLRALQLNILLLVVLISPSMLAQDINSRKPGVVRIENSRNGDVGTGVIVKVDGRQVYVITASHVVRGDQHPSIYLFNQQRDALKAELLDREDDDTKGLALLRLKVNSVDSSGITALSLGSTSQIDGGEDVRTIGFPDAVGLWTVGGGTVARLEGRNLVFSGSIRGGNSGGPVIFNGLVIGMITDASQAVTYAARSEVIEIYVNGLIPNLISLSRPTEEGHNRSNDQFCQTLTKLLEASRSDFYPIVGAATNSENTFYPKIMLPGALAGGYVIPKQRVYYPLMNGAKERGTVESEFYALVSKVKVCQPTWEESETSDSSYRYHTFKTGQGTTVVRVYFNLVAQGSRFFLTVSMDLSP